MSFVCIVTGGPVFRSILVMYRPILVPITTHLGTTDREAISSISPRLVIPTLRPLLTIAICL